jgi:hypothetical protein
MNRHLLLFGRPNIEEVVPRPPLGLSGSLSNHSQGLAYSGYLTIEDAVGKCTARLVSGTLPAGARVYADTLLSRVYVKWDALGDGSPVSTVPDGSLENGGEGWTIGTGLSVSSAFAQSGTKSLAFVNYTGTTEALSAPVEFGAAAQVTGRCQIAQGASGKNVVTGQVFLEAGFDGGAKLRYYGSLVNSSSGGPWRESLVTAEIPASAISLAIGVQMKRRFANHVAYADSFTWSHYYVPGSQVATDYAITVEVKDGLNRTAQWSGVIVESPPNGTYIEHVGTGYSQSTVYPGTVAASLSNMRDTNVDPPTGACANTGSGEWIMLDLGSSKEVATFVLGSGVPSGYPSGTGIMGNSNVRVQYADSPSGSWTTATHGGRINSYTDNPPTDYQYPISPMSARYWRVSSVAAATVRTMTFRAYGYVGGLVLRTPIYSQSSVYAGTTAASAAVLNDVPNSLTSGAGTNAGAGQYIQADLGAVFDVRRIVLSAGNLAGWGSVSSYLLACSIITSLDGISWSTPVPLSGVAPDGPDAGTAAVTLALSTSARYVRLINAPGFVATTAFRIYTL